MFISQPTQPTAQDIAMAIELEKMRLASERPVVITVAKPNTEKHV